jgi:endonuclease/exonuclease/phosphatase family metal-dependent hydrolase
VALDKILYRDPIRCHHVACVLDEVTKVASDHLPLMVELETPLSHRSPRAAVRRGSARG